uniref:Uncharacterized protein n=1 Tax=Oryza punctata TaxID=4537 RepID=A0A0E0LC27_ORYPU
MTRMAPIKTKTMKHIQGFVARHSASGLSVKYGYAHQKRCCIAKRPLHKRVRKAGSSSTPVAVPLNIAPEILRVISPKNKHIRCCAFKVYSGGTIIHANERCTESRSPPAPT